MGSRIQSVLDYGVRKRFYRITISPCSRTRHESPSWNRPCISSYGSEKAKEAFIRRHKPSWGQWRWPTAIVGEEKCGNVSPFPVLGLVSQYSNDFPPTTFGLNDFLFISRSPALLQRSQRFLRVIQFLPLSPLILDKLVFLHVSPHSVFAPPRVPCKKPILILQCGRRE